MHQAAWETLFIRYSFSLHSSLGTLVLSHTRFFNLDAVDTGPETALCGSCLVHCRIFGSIPDLDPLETTSAPHPTPIVPSNVPRYCQIDVP